MSARRTKGAGDEISLAGIGSFVLVALAVWLGWQVFRELAAVRLPPALALRVAPDDPGVLARAAEGELQANRFDNAEALARLSLARAPFNVPALRVVGLVTAKKPGRESEADNMLTLAGNWSLRDDPTHAWLVEYRLSRGDYRSAFAHADTLARRRPDLRPQLFKLFTTAATLDPRTIPVLTRLLAVNPPWRAAYVQSLYASDEGLGLGVNLALMLQATPASAFTDRELTGLFTYLMRRGRLPTMAELRRRLNRPPHSGQGVVDGDFTAATTLLPYGWKFFTAPGAFVEVTADDLRAGDQALRVEYNGMRLTTAAEQFLQLPPGRYRFGGQQRVEIGDVGDHVSWTVSCFETQTTILDAEAVPSATAQDWRDFSAEFVVPASRCSGQWLRLKTKPADRRTTLAVWYDRLSIAPAP